MFKREQVFASTLEYFQGDALAADVFVNKYCLQDEDGYYETTPQKMHWRLAQEFARPDLKYEFKLDDLPSVKEGWTKSEYYEFYAERVSMYFQLIDRFKFVIPQGSPMSALGNPYQIQSASNCFVLPSVEDSYSQIMKTDQELAQLSKRRGGVGFDISKLRPEGAPVSNAAKTSSGIVSFMERFSNTTREVGQNGRRAALLMSCSVHHPDIEKFITIKRDRTKVTGANISVAITDEFMKAVIEDIDYEQRWPCEGVEPKIRRVKRARDIWDLIIKNAWENAEPGVIFIDKMRNYPGQHYDGYEVVSTNPLMIAA